MIRMIRAACVLLLAGSAVSLSACGDDKPAETPLEQLERLIIEYEKACFGECVAYDACGYAGDDDDDDVDECKAECRKEASLVNYKTPLTETALACLNSVVVYIECYNQDYCNEDPGFCLQEERRYERQCEGDLFWE